ncbi:TerC family protein [Cutibacterium modestum]|uniref:TerC family protein n=1 Tax=Cutibacterium modestum TaxID=2559073 RepID=UPI0020A3AF3B|nr:TerC family protein [Cutibacterium modestum]MCP2378575.1 TerC family integral membrane protein [Cutibacterium modestum 31N]
MHVHAYVWIITILVMGALLFFDVLVLGRKPHVPSTKECVAFVGVFVVLAVLFGLGVWILQGRAAGGQFYAVWLTEYSLSIDNLFIFLILMEKFNVPRKLQQFALLVGIIVALVFRGVFITLGQAILEAWAWVFFIFGAFLLYSAIDQVREYRHHDDEDEDSSGEGRFMTWFKRTVPTTGDYRGTKFFVRENGKIIATSMFMVCVALGATDLLFALDSIPASYGLTSEGYLIFTANVFALMGLRQLYFLIGSLLERLVYLSLGLAVTLGFIAFKLIGHAMHHYGLDQAWFGSSTEVSIGVSLGVIVATLLATTIASLIKSRKDDAKAEV